MHVNTENTRSFTPGLTPVCRYGIQASQSIMDVHFQNFLIGCIIIILYERKLNGSYLFSAHNC